MFQKTLIQNFRFIITCTFIIARSNACKVTYQTMNINVWACSLKRKMQETTLFTWKVMILIWYITSQIIIQVLKNISLQHMGDHIIYGSPIQVCQLLVWLCFVLPSSVQRTPDNILAISWKLSENLRRQIL